VWIFQQNREYIQQATKPYYQLHRTANKLAT